MKNVHNFQDMKAKKEELTFEEKVDKELTGVMEPIFIEMLKRASKKDISLVEELRAELEKDTPLSFEEQVKKDIEGYVKEFQESMDSLSQIFVEAQKKGDK